MSRKLFGLLILLIFLSFLNGCSGFPKELRISQTKLQKLVEKRFPYQKDLILGEITLDAPVIYFKEEKIGLKLNYEGVFLKQSINGIIDLNGEICYRQKQQAFYLTNLNIVEFNQKNFSWFVLTKVKNLLFYILAYFFGSNMR